LKILGPARNLATLMDIPSGDWHLRAPLHRLRRHFHGICRHLQDCLETYVDLADRWRSRTVLCGSAPGWC